MPNHQACKKSLKNTCRRNEYKEVCVFLLFLFSNSFRASSLPYAKAMPTERRSSSLLERFAEVQLALCEFR